MDLKVGTRVRIKNSCSLYSQSEGTIGTIIRFDSQDGMIVEDGWFTVQWKNGDIFWYKSEYIEIIESVNNGQLMLIQEV